LILFGYPIIEWDDIMKKYDVIVIGAGLAGLTAAYRLSVAGKAVLLLEKENFLGGRTSSFNDDGMKVEAGFHSHIGYYKKLPSILNEVGVHLDDIIVWEDDIEIKLNEKDSIFLGIDPILSPVKFVKRIMGNHENIFQCILMLALMLFNYATIFTSLYRQLMLYRKQQSERILQEQKNMLKAQLENQQQIRRMKHDMKGYSATLLGLLSEGKIKEAVIYLKGVETEMDTLEGTFCANPYINAVFVQYSGKLEELGAECSMDIQAGEEELPYMDLCQILSNGLENACDELRKLDRKSRKVSVEMKYHRNHLIIRIQNRCRESLYVDKGKIPATDKAEPGHGFGLPTIQAAAGRLGGDMMCYTEEGNFVLEVMVSLVPLRERIQMAG